MRLTMQESGAGRLTAADWWTGPRKYPALKSLAYMQSHHLPEKGPLSSHQPMSAVVACKRQELPLPLVPILLKTGHLLVNLLVAPGLWPTIS